MSAKKCRSCGAWVYPGDAGCECYVAELERQDDATPDEAVSHARERRAAS